MHDRPAQQRPARRLSRGTRLATVSATVALALVGAVLAASSPAATAPPVPCDQVTEFTWDGALGDETGSTGDGTSWSDPNNWKEDCVPGERFPVHDYDDHVTIPAGSNVTLPDGTSAHVGTLVNHGSLTVDHATLETRASSTSHTLTMTDGFLVGKGPFKVTSLLSLERSMQGSRRCDPGWPENDCSAAVPVDSVGTTVVAPGARMVLRGWLNLDDHRVIVNRGTVILAQGTDGRIAADDGTLFRNRGTFRIRNDRGYYQGNTPVWEPGRSQFVNTGTVQKSAGSGLSVIDAIYTNTDSAVPGTGRVSVQSGDLSIASLGTTDARQADVGAGVTLGNGGPESCDAIAGGPNCERVVPTAGDEAVTTVRVPDATAVSIREVGTEPSSADFLTAPVEIKTPEATATPSAPLTFTILIDSTALGSNTPLDVAQDSAVWRKGGGSAWAVQPNCGTGQKPTQSKPTCVARTLSVNKTTAMGGGDAAIVIRSLQNSRYRVGH